MSALDSMQSTTLGTGTKRYMPGLDGLRALSVMAVIAYHLNFVWTPGGFLGVGIFFTLSGYLITDQLIMQWKETNKINLKDFWMRRIRRLMPAMFFMLAMVYLWLTLFDPLRLAMLKSDFISVILYFNNWWLIFHNISYFDSFGPPSPIGHLWSLAIEEQFYFFWPVILAILLRFVPRRHKLILFTFIGALASILAMTLIYEPGTDPSRVYYGTDTRAFALLIGAAFAIAYPSQTLSKQISAKSSLLLDFIGGAGLLGIILMIWRTNEYDASLYVGGLALFAILSAIVTVVLAHPASRVARFMGCKPLRWIGVRSYSLYLWHYPVIIFTSPTVDSGEFNVRRIILQLAVSFLLAALCWKLIEEPIRRGSLSKLWRSKLFWGNRGFLEAPIRRRSLFILVIAPLLFITSCTRHLTEDTSLVISPVTAELGQAEISPTTIEELPSPWVDSEEPASDIIERSSSGQSQVVNSPVSKAEAGKGITAIGDSVILDAAPYLEKILPGIIIDGKVGRQMAQAQEVVDQLKAKGKLGDRVIIELGTNGPFTIKQVSELLTSLGDAQQVILVNTRVPRKWQNKVNSDLETVAAEFPNVTLVDWFSASQGKESIFYDDGVHLKEEGAKYYASLVSEAVMNEER
jgi:peptidoglycan/LPS O-acetylase OafA/YrhL